MIAADDPKPIRYQAISNHDADSTVAMVLYKLYHAKNTSYCSHQLKIFLGNGGPWSDGIIYDPQIAWLT